VLDQTPEKKKEKKKPSKVLPVQYYRDRVHAPYYLQYAFCRASTSRKKTSNGTVLLTQKVAETAIRIVRLSVVLSFVSVLWKAKEECF